MDNTHDIDRLLSDVRDTARACRDLQESMNVLLYVQLTTALDGGSLYHDRAYNKLREVKARLYDEMFPTPAELP